MTAWSRREIACPHDRRLMLCWRSFARHPRAPPARGHASEREGKKVKLGFFGASLVPAYGKGAATYYRGILSALTRRDWEIAFYEPDAGERQAHRDIPDPQYARSVVYSVGDE